MIELLGWKAPPLLWALAARRSQARAVLQLMHCPGPRTELPIQQHQP